jgi:hypothetical protein
MHATTTMTLIRQDWDLHWNETTRKGNKIENQCWGRNTNKAVEIRYREIEEGTI